MQRITVETEQFMSLLGVTPWHVFWNNSIPIDGIGKPQNYIFTTYSGTSPVFFSGTSTQKVGGIANYRCDFENKRPVVKRYEIVIEYTGGSLIAQNCTNILRPYEHHIYGLTYFNPVIWKTVPNDWKSIVTDFFEHPEEWK